MSKLLNFYGTGATSIPGCTNPPETCAAVCHFAMDMVHCLEDYNREHLGEPLAMRIGVNTGPVVAGVVGTRHFLYDIWGDAVNIASRMKSTGVSGRVQVTQAVVDAVPAADIKFEGRGKIAVKGIADMETFLITDRSKTNARRYWSQVRSSVASRSLSDRGRRASTILELLQHASQLDD